MSQQVKTTVSHIGICTSDVKRSVQFYQALGFELAQSIDEIGAPYDTLAELPGMKFCAHYLHCGGVTLELLGYLNSEVSGSGERRPMNQLGFTHITLMVDDLEAASECVTQNGGRVLSETRIDSPYGPIVFCTDPDGVRVELMESTG